MKKVIIFSIFLFSLVAVAQDNFPVTEEEWYAEATNRNKEINNDRDRRLALLLKVVHMRVDQIVNKKEINEEIIDNITDIKNRLHTYPWWGLTDGNQYEDIFKLTENLYLRLKNLDKELSENSTYSTPAPKPSRYVDTERDKDKENIEKLIKNYYEEKKNQTQWETNF